MRVVLLEQTLEDSGRVRYCRYLVLPPWTDGYTALRRVVDKGRTFLRLQVSDDCARRRRWR